MVRCGPGKPLPGFIGAKKQPGLNPSAESVDFQTSVSPNPSFLGVRLGRCWVRI
jgi:hypothetical protein